MSSWARSQPVLPLCASVSPPCHSCTLLLPHELQAASIYWEERLARPTQCPHAQVLHSLNLRLSFSSAISAACGAQQLIFFLILCRLNWMEQTFMNVDPELKKSRIQHVKRVSDRGSHFDSSTGFTLWVKKCNMTQPSARSIMINFTSACNVDTHAHTYKSP